MADSLALIRSGATDYDLQGRIRGSLDIPLCGEGIAEAGRAAAALAAAPPVALYTSTAACAIETSRIIGRAVGLRPRRIANLGNLDQGLWQGLLVDEIRRKQPRLYRQWQDNPWCVSPPEGELLEAACGRVENTLEKILRSHPAGRIALVVPAPLDRIVLWLLAGVSMGDLWTREPQPSPLVDVPLTTQWSAAARNESPGNGRPGTPPRHGRLQKLRS
jgi:broad specificity phosphatase PhoE